MTDQKFTAESDDNDTKTLSNVALFAADVESTDAKLHRLDVTPRSSNATYSLGKLEEDLRMLHGKWRAVESEISNRDERIAILEQEIDGFEDRFEAQRAEHDRQLADKEAALDVARHEQATLLAEKQDLERDLASQGRATAESNDRLGELEAQNSDLRVHMQELQAYIDGRKGDWDDMQARIRVYEDTIEGMSGSLESHQEIVAGKDREKAGLALKVMDLERELSELKGRYAEREASYAEKQHALEQQSREVGGLNGEVIGLHKDIEKMQKKLQRREATVKSLRKDLKERGRDSTTLEGLLAEEQATITELQLKLKVANQRIADLEAEQHSRVATADELGMTVGELRERLRLSEPTISKQEARIEELEKALRASESQARQATENEIRAAELQAQLLEAQSEQKSVEDELEAQRELVTMLEKELSDKQQNLDVLDRSADRLSAIGSGIRELDMQIDDLWLREPVQKVTPTQEIFELPDEEMVMPEELFDVGEETSEHLIVANDDQSGEEVRYPLRGKEITIGRSQRCDIWLKSMYISRTHARILVDGEQAIIEDAGSMNGFFVNSVPTRRHKLQDGDQLQIGDSKLRYVHN